MMRILLIAPSRLDDQQRPIKYRKAFLPPLSLAILSGLTPREHCLKVINDLVEEIDFTANYDLVGITAMSCQVERAYQIAAEFRSRGIKVVMGGVHPTLLPEEVKLHADSVVIGEAERIWPVLLQDMEKGCLQAVYKDDGYPDLSDSPIPRWDTMDLSIYPHRLGSKVPVMPLFTTRGCPYGCKFCSVTKLYGKSYRSRPVDDVLREIDRTGARELFFVDDNIACDPDYSRALFRALKGKGVTWISQISTTVLKNPDLIDLAAQSGCFYLFVGMESLNPSSLENANKGFNKIEQYSELIRRMHKAGIIPFTSFIFGFDEDTDAHFRLTLEFLRKEKVGFAAFWILTPLPGTDLQNELESAGRIIDRRWSSYDGATVVFKPKTFTPEELTRRYWETFAQYYSWWGIWSHLIMNVRYSGRRLEELFRNLFYQPYFWRKVSRHDHPFSGGIGRL
jgi:radical SAM superfamily enzyme YgiQ (UPF0313 family)